MEESDSFENEKTLLNEKSKSKQPLIMFTKLNKYFLFPFLSPIFCMLSNYFLDKILHSNIIINGFMLIVFVQFSYAAGGSLYFISYFHQKLNKRNDNNVTSKIKKNNYIKYIYNKGIKKNWKKIWLILITISLIVTVNDFTVIFYKDKHLFKTRLLIIFFIPIFSKYILAEKIYKHQYLSLFVLIIGIILLIIPVCFVFEQSDIIPNIIKSISAICYSLFLVMIKYLAQVYYISPLKIGLLYSILAIIFSSFGFIIYSLIKYHDLSYFNNCIDFSQVDNKATIIIYIILCFIFTTCLQVFTLLVIFYFSPIILMVTDIISPMLTWIVTTIEKGPIMPDVIVCPIGYFISLFSSLIYNEIIIFSFCGLNENTKRFIVERQNAETKRLTKDEEKIKYDDFIDEDIGSINSDVNSNSSL